jgi:hypothetical protein
VWAFARGAVYQDFGKGADKRGQFAAGLLQFLFGERVGDSSAGGGAAGLGDLFVAGAEKGVALVGVRDVVG